MLFAGRLLPLKGGALAIQTMRYLTAWQLVVCGEGPDETRLRRLANELGVADRVDFRGWLRRDDLLGLMRDEASVLLFPSLHDQAPWIVGEALTMGVPAICLDQGGAPALGATCVSLDGPVNTPIALAEAVLRTPRGPLPRWDIDSRQEELRRLLLRKGLLARVGP